MNRKIAARVFWCVTGFVIFLAFLGKLWWFIFDRADSNVIHPLFPFATNQGIAIVALLAEAAVLAGMFRTDYVGRTALPTSLFLTFLLYRLGLWGVDQSYDCGCFGGLHRFLWFTSTSANWIAWTCDIVFPPVGAALLLLEWRANHDRANSVNVCKSTSHNDASKRWRKRIGIAVLLALIFPPLQVLYVRFVNPHTTMPAFLYALSHHPPRPKIKWRDLDRVPAEFLGALINAEDGRFCSHFGFDFQNIGASLRHASKTGRSPAGASTITQQCARSLFLWQGRSWVRKVIEAYYTVCMECLLSKRRILELYVNVIELADGVFGVEAGAEHHFHVSISDANTQQMAGLIAVMPSPKKLSPANLPTAYESRRLNAERDVQRIHADIYYRTNFPAPCIQKNN